MKEIISEARVCGKEDEKTFPDGADSWSLHWWTPFKSLHPTSIHFSISNLSWSHISEQLHIYSFKMYVKWENRREQTYVVGLKRG
jgi:hypothetical protein